MSKIGKGNQRNPQAVTPGSQEQAAAATRGSEDRAATVPANITSEDTARKGKANAS